MRGVAGCQQNGFDHADLTRGSCPGNVKSRPVVHRGPEDRHAVRDGDRPVKIQGLGRDMSLIMIQGQYTVVTPLGRLVEDGIRANGTGYPVSSLLQLFYRGHDLPYLFPAEQTVLTAVGIEARNCHGPFRYAQPLQRPQPG